MLCCGGSSLQNKALCVSVVWQHIRTGVWGAKLRIVRRGKRKRSQTHSSPHENRVSDLKLSQSPCIHIHRWKNNLVTKAYYMGIVGKFKLEYTSVLDWGTLSFTPFLKLKWHYVRISGSLIFSLTNTRKQKLWLFIHFVLNILPF